MKNKKILILCNSYSHGGGEKVAVNLGNGLYEKGYDVSFFLIENEVTYRINKNIRLIKNPINIKAPLLGALINNLSALICIVFLSKKEGFDVVISHLFRSNYINVISSRLSKYKSVIVTHGSISKYLGNRFSSKINIFLIKKLFPKANAKVFLTQRMLEDYSPYVGVNNNYVIENGYDLAEIKELSLGSMESVPFDDYFVFVGRFHKVKNIPFILEVFTEIGFNLLLIGDGPDFLYLKDKNKNKNIHFMGRQNNPYPYIKNAKALILASHSEGFPSVIIEAIALNTFVISSDCPTGPREIIGVDKVKDKDKPLFNDFGGLFEVNNKDEFVSLIKYAVYEHRKNMNGSSYASKFYISSMANSFIESVLWWDL